MIRGQSKRDGTLAAVVVCDVCNRVIDNAGKAAMVYRSPGLGEDEFYTVMHVHKGECFDRAEVELAGKDGAPWCELTDHINEVITSTGLTFDKLVMKEVATRVNVLYYGDVREAFVKAIAD